MTRTLSTLLVLLRIALLLLLISALGLWVYMLARYGPTWDWHQQWAYFYGNRVAIGAGLGLAVMDFLATAPRTIPRSAQEFWTWGLQWGVHFFRVPQPATPPPPPHPPELPFPKA